MATHTESNGHRASLKVGDRFSVTIEKVAHGGHFIARHLGAVIFVRHAIPGEECVVELTSVGSSFNRGDVVEVITPSEDRATAPCVYAHAKGCGGCDFQHITPARQRELKRDVIIESFARIAKKQVDVEVIEVGPSLGWRTHFGAVTTNSGNLGFYKSRSHSVVPITDCRIAAQGLNLPELASKKWKGNQRIEISLSNTGEVTVASGAARVEGPLDLISGSDPAHYKVGEKVLEVSQKAFWQSHEKAPQVLTKAVLELAKPLLGEKILDLYGGVGLFTSVLLEAVGEDGRVDLVEGSKAATADATRNFSGHPNVGVHTGDVGKILPRFAQADVIVLDPPREGAGREVLQHASALAPRAIVYVACDPAALARDVTYLEEYGYSMDSLSAYDLFPMTHHIESVALFTPIKVS